MVDSVSPEQRSRNMSRIRGRDTQPEKTVRSILHRAGFRFRLHRKDLPGKPDIVLSRYRTVIFVHGCFWHQHRGCKRATTPTSRTEYWIPKLKGNVTRDEKHVQELKKMGWTTICVWECELKDSEELSTRIKRALNAAQPVVQDIGLDV